jgi:prepilin-type N-terminal cleavage/methylation domain-containing protein
MIAESNKIMRHDKGFTLIELLVVIAIIGILAAIAIPQFATYRQRANDGAAVSDLRNMAVALEAFYVANNAYVGATGGVAGNLAATYGYPADTDPNTGTAYTTITGQTATSWTAAATHTGGTGRVFNWDSAGGGCTNC